ncbi:MAG: IS110 family transposase [Deltaproteobacteria bacterium]|nr:IS110 family transposase [Deltaproteobacteria bacterium]
MEQYAGLDVSLEETFVCVVDREGRKVWSGKCESTPAAIDRTLRSKARQLVRVGLESGPLSTWHWHGLRELGQPVVCLDARHAHAALSVQSNKTDANDAEGLAQITRTGWYREVQVKSLDSHLMRTLIGSRRLLVDMRTRITNHLRGILKTFGLVVGKVSGQAFIQRVQELTNDNNELGLTVSSLVISLERIAEQILVMESRIKKRAREDEVCRRLMTVPGVGPMTALAFISVIDDPGRFPKSSSVGAYLGLTPRRYQSGEVDRNGRISKCGDKLLRYHLFEAATTLLTRVAKWSRVKAWAMGIAKRRGSKKAKVALARKLAVIMHRIWLDGANFRWSDKPQPSAS